MVLLTYPTGKTDYCRMREHKIVKLWVNSYSERKILKLSSPTFPSWNWNIEDSIELWISRGWKSARKKLAQLSDKPWRSLMPLVGSLGCVEELECSSHPFNYHFSSLSVIPTHHDFIVLLWIVYICLYTPEWASYIRIYWWAPNYHQFTVGEQGKPHIRWMVIGAVWFQEPENLINGSPCSYDKELIPKHSGTCVIWPKVILPAPTLVAPL